MNKNRYMTAILSDIKGLEVDAIVNAANQSLLGGGGVDGAIHRAAGPGLLNECRNLGGCKTGEAKITSGHNLAAKYVIHTVGPVWRGGKSNEESLLKSCYLSSLNLAKKYDCQSIAFPCISTGIYGFPAEPAAIIAINSCYWFIEQNGPIMKILFCCFLESDFEIYERMLCQS